MIEQLNLQNLIDTLEAGKKPWHNSDIYLDLINTAPHGEDYPEWVDQINQTSLAQSLFRLSRNVPLQQLQDLPEEQKLPATMLYIINKTLLTSQGNSVSTGVALQKLGLTEADTAPEILGRLNNFRDELGVNDSALNIFPDREAPSYALNFLIAAMLPAEQRNTYLVAKTGWNPEYSSRNQDIGMLIFVEQFGLVMHEIAKHLQQGNLQELAEKLSSY